MSGGLKGVPLKDLSTSHSEAPANITLLYGKRMKSPYVVKDVIKQDFEKCPLSWIIGVVHLSFKE